jgi:hypothetical protein
LLISCSSLPCNVVAKDYISQVDAIAADWDSANKLAGSAPRMQLVTPISKLQDIYAQMDELDVPECAQPTHDLLMKYMEATIDGYISFLSDEEDSVVGDHFDKASTYFEEWQTSFTELQSP